MDKIKTNFQGQTIFIGMDIHKASSNLCIYLNNMFIKNVHPNRKRDYLLINETISNSNVALNRCPHRTL